MSNIAGIAIFYKGKKFKNIQQSGFFNHHKKEYAILYIKNYSITQVLNIIKYKNDLSRNILIRNEKKRVCLYYRTYNSHSPKLSIYLGLYLAFNVFNFVDFEIYIKNIGINYRLNSSEIRFIKEYNLM